MLTKITPDYEVLLKEPCPFEMDLPWSNEGFAQRFYDVVHDWGIPTEKEISFIESYLHGNSRLLDLACGGGRHAIGLAEKGHNVTGIEIGWYPLSLARERAEKKELTIEFFQNDILKLNYRSEFDCAFLICGQLGHFSPNDSQIVFENASRAIRKNGTFLIHLFGFGDEDKSNFTSWYTEKKAFYFENPSFVHREQYYNPSNRVKIIRDFAVDTITRQNALFGVSEKNYTAHELSQMGKNCGLKLIESFGNFDKSPLKADSRENIYVFIKK
ncbi:MAG: methyltransferase domain-containing protein [Candidatus Zixiibacteriota bacterium]